MSEPKIDRTRGKKRTIVGGRPRERRPGRGGIPRGIEVLVKKASLDPAFYQLLLGRRAGAAAEIDLELTSAEKAILDAVPEAQLKSMVENTKVPDMQRRAFLGQIGAAMLAAVTTGCYPPTAIIEKEGGIRPEDEATLTSPSTATSIPQVVVTREVTRILGHVVKVTVTPTPIPRDTPTISLSTSTTTPEGTPTALPAATSIQPEAENRDTPAPGPVVRGIRPDRP